MRFFFSAIFFSIFSCAAVQKQPGCIGGRMHTEVDYQLAMLNSRSNGSAQGSTVRTDEFPSRLRDSLIDLGCSYHILSYPYMYIPSIYSNDYLSQPNWVLAIFLSPPVLKLLKIGLVQSNPS